VTEPIWLQVARRDTGLLEMPGASSSPRILEMARAIGAPAWYHNDDQPWCAVAMNAWLLESELPMALGTRGDAFDRLRALTFLGYGQPLSGPALGAIAVFSRPEGAHVGIYLGEHLVETAANGKPARRMIRVFGGNQRNRVCELWLNADRLRGFRWPPRVTLPTLATVPLGFDGLVSVNEA